MWSATASRKAFLAVGAHLHIYESHVLHSNTHYDTPNPAQNQGKIIKAVLQNVLSCVTREENTCTAGMWSSLTDTQ